MRKMILFHLKKPCLKERKNNPFYYRDKYFLEEYEVKGKVNEIPYKLRKLELGDKRNYKKDGFRYEEYSLRFRGSHVLWKTTEEHKDTDIIIMSKEFFKATAYPFDEVNKNIYGYTKQDIESNNIVLFTKGKVNSKDMKMVEHIYHIVRDLYEPTKFIENKCILYGFEPAIRYTGKIIELLLCEAGTWEYTVEQRIEDVEKFLSIV